MLIKIRDGPLRGSRRPHRREHVAFRSTRLAVGDERAIDHFAVRREHLPQFVLAEADGTVLEELLDHVLDQTAIKDAVEKSIELILRQPKDDRLSLVEQELTQI